MELSPESKRKFDKDKKKDQKRDNTEGTKSPSNPKTPTPRDKKDKKDKKRGDTPSAPKDKKDKKRGDTPSAPKDKKEKKDKKDKIPDDKKGMADVDVIKIKAVESKTSKTSKIQKEIAIVGNLQEHIGKSIIKRLMKDIKYLLENGPKDNIHIAFKDDNLGELYMLLFGPEKSPYQGCLFPFSMTFNNYPTESPKLKFVCPYTIRCHPNLYKEGKVCLSILGTWQGPPWTSMMTINTIAQNIFGILDEEPLRNEPGYEHAKEGDERVNNYTEYVQYICIKETIENFLIPILRDDKKIPSIFKLFKNAIISYYIDNKQKYIEYLKKLSLNDGKRIPNQVGYGNSTLVGENYNYRALLDKLP